MFWAALLVALLFLLHLLGSTVTPFVVGIALGYLLDPLVTRLASLGLNRLGAALLILTVFVVVIAIVLIVVVPILSDELFKFAQRLPGYVTRLQALVIEEGDALIRKYGEPWLGAFGLGEAPSSAQIQKSVGDLVEQGAQWLLAAAKSLLSGGAAVFNFLSLLVITPVVAFYVLLDWDGMVAKIDSWLPLDHRELLRAIAKETNRAWSGFIRGQSLVCLCMAFWYGLGLTYIGLDFGFLIGVLGGVLGFIPYVGGLTVLVLSLGVAIVQGWPSLRLFLMALTVVGSGQFLEGYVISPKLVGESIGLHPVWLMFALLAFGKLLGFAGLIVAVPVAAAIGVLARQLIAFYLTSPLYRGHRPQGTDDQAAPS